ERLTGIVADMEAAAARGESLRTSDRDFHHVLFEPIDNAFLSELLTVFWDVYSGIHQSVETFANENTDHVTDTAAAHGGILAAVAAGDETTAARLLGAHFVGIRRLIDRATANAHPTTGSFQEVRT
ncbi:FCD domain-containing protein, partial [Streptomyces sp. tea 10]|nr:FCD domain-containing protein [Streptomyces sp. tea 10]